MTEKTVFVKAASGLHARPASQLCNMMKTYSGTAEMVLGSKTADLKSILNIMSLGVKKNSSVVIRVNGEDEEQTAQKIADLLINLEN